MDRHLGPESASNFWVDLAELPEARIIDLVRLATIPVQRSSSVAVKKLPTISWAAFLRIPWVKSFQSSA